jgi:hypothetical protein
MDPLTLALLGGGSSIVGSWLNGSAQDRVNEARNGIVQAERGRQAGFDAETGKLNDQSLGRYVNFDTQLDAKRAALAEMFKTPVVTPNTQYTAAPLPPVSSDLVAREVNNKNDIAKAYVDHQADTMANLKSFGDLFGGIGRGQARDAQLVGQIGGFKKGSAEVEKLELDNANRAGNDLKMWADIASGLGKVGLTAGLSGAFAPAAALSGAGGTVAGALGPTSLNGAPLIGATPNVFASGAAPFLTYGRA